MHGMIVNTYSLPEGVARNTIIYRMFVSWNPA